MKGGFVLTVMLMVPTVCIQIYGRPACVALHCVGFFFKQQQHLHVLRCRTSEVFAFLTFGTFKGMILYVCASKPVQNCCLETNASHTSIANGQSVVPLCCPACTAKLF